MFVDSTGQCTQAARASIRLGFHDAGAWSTTAGFGGADGSMLISPDEINRPENAGLQDIVNTGRYLLQKYQPYGIGAADLVQWMANVGTVSCPLGPRILSFVGRDDSANDPTGLLPDVNSDADTLLQLFADKTFIPNDLAALVGAHSASNQFFVDPALSGEPQDTTPGVWDILYYSEILSNASFPNVFKFQSDINLANAPQTNPSFNIFSVSLTKAISSAPSLLFL